MYLFIYLYYFFKIFIYKGGKNGMDECVFVWFIFLIGNFIYLIMIYLIYDNVYLRFLMKE